MATDVSSQLVSIANTVHAAMALTYLIDVIISKTLTDHAPFAPNPS